MLAEITTSLASRNRTTMQEVMGISEYIRYAIQCHLDHLKRSRRPRRKNKGKPVSSENQAAKVQEGQSGSLGCGDSVAGRACCVSDGLANAACNQASDTQRSEALPGAAVVTGGDLPASNPVCTAP
jgi:hypothetical protein